VTGLIRKSNVPAVSISIDIDGFYYAGIEFICAKSLYLKAFHGIRHIFAENTDLIF